MMFHLANILKAYNPYKTCATILECTVNQLNTLKKNQSYYYGKIDQKTEKKNEMIYINYESHKMGAIKFTQ